MTTLSVRAGLVCAGVLALSGCGVAAQGLETSDESVGSVESALTATQRATAINNKAAANSALVGAATTAYANTPTKPGGFRHYANNASIYIGDSVGYAAIVLGFNRGKWSALGWENSVLGFPTTDEFPNAFGTGRYNLFEGGRILWKNGAGASFETHGCIDAIYGRLGFEGGTLAFPTSDETAIGDRLKNNFERGRIYFRNNSSASCDFKTWPVLNTTSTANQLASQGAPRITGLSVFAAQIGAHISVQGAGFTPGRALRFFINSPEGQGSSRNGKGTIVAADGTFSFSTQAASDYFSSAMVIKINNVVTVEAYEATGKMAVLSTINTTVGSNYASPY